MSSLGLKTNIAINIAILVFAGMVLTAYMVVSLLQHTLITTEAEKASFTVSAIEEFVTASHSAGFYGNKGAHYSQGIRRILFNSGASGFVVVFPNLNVRYEQGETNDIIKALSHHAKDAFKNEKTTIRLTGHAWGTFWKHKKNLQFSAPVYAGKINVAGVSILMPLRPIFQKVRKVLNVIFLYILINAILFTLVGVYQISKSAVKPVQRLLHRANEYHSENTSVIFEEKSGNEFKQLSSALNNMLGRISDDKSTLQETVRSLEDANRELKKAQKEIVRAEKLASVGRLSSGIAHEIGNPLGIVSGYLELIKDDFLPEEQKTDFIKRAEDELKRIDTIIRQLLDYSRLSKESRETVQINTIIADVTTMLDVQPFMNAIKISIGDISETITVIADYDQLRQVFLNVSINAADAINASVNKSNGQINIDVRQLDERVRISYEDNGEGIAEDDLGNVFDPFFTTKEPGKGTGLGLSVCFMIIEAFNGRIEIESEIGKGAIVTIDLPLAGKLHETG